MTLLIGMVLAVIASLFGGVGSLFLKKGSGKFRLNIKAILKNKNLIIGVVCFGIATLLFIPALRFGELNVLYPIISLTYVWAIFLSKKYLKEKINVFKWTGIIFIILGIILITS
jgi:undecaprenyl phosphate-alpha-L-ara4N flippase subunit ArnE